MPSDKKANQKYSILKHLSTEELENLLCQDFDVSDDKEPDVDYIMAIMEVIHEREAMPAAEATAIVDAAWNDFRENYQGQSTAYGTEALQESESSHLDQISMPKSSKRRVRAYRYVVIAALVGLLMCGAASAFGFNVFQALAGWTAETFGFISTESSDKSKKFEDPFEQLRTIIEDEIEYDIIPTWAPEGTAQEGDISVSERSDGLKISSIYKTQDGQLHIRVILRDSIPQEYEGTYQKNDEPVDEYISGGVTHYLMSNYDINMAVWTNDCAEILIQGDLSRDTLEKMIDSIYEE